ncbi:MAG: heavy metal translocating P-type ATPase [Corallococcus sp.]|nr:heavy metal translocating P-type ATPase [Corallococcus sp.]MCM1359840.1 heavy metal translocating P-type ATPase [Corallococcus sp.]MCM1395274.1 heavy metal translocating P-type ATPase [Corallococcus sp.]
MKQKFTVTGMTCSACSSHVEKAVKKLDGVKSVSVSLLTNGMQVDFDEKAVTSDAIVDAVQKSGYGAQVLCESGISRQKPVSQKQMPSGVSLFRLLLSAVFCVVLMYVAMGHMIGAPLPGFLSGTQNALSFALAQFLLCLPVWYVNRSYFTVGFKRLFKGSPNMDTLIAVGSFAGALYGVITMFIVSAALGRGDMATVAKYHHELYFESSAMILALVDLGKYFEGRSKTKTGDALSKLRKLVPNSALLVSGDSEREVDSATLAPGDIVAVKSGMSFPSDGVVVFGNCFANESAISGESLPVEKNVDSRVIGGTVNAGGYVRVRVTNVGQQSVLSQIIALVEDAGSSKAPIQRLADKISGVFVPVVMSLALVTFIVWACVTKSVSDALGFGISVLVISCPCALGLATPVAIMVATGKGAQNGILVKSGEILERLASVKQVVLDKTGTVTLGEPKVKNFWCNTDEKHFFAVIGGIEKQSEHPLGKAVVDYAETLSVSLLAPSDFQTLAGRGVVATTDGITYAIGNALLMKEQGADISPVQALLEEYSEKALTCLIVSQNGKVTGIIGVGDEIKPTSKEAVAKLHSLGIKTVLLTGDNKLAAKAVCEEVGIDTYFAEVLPDEKEQKVRELMQSGVTAMVGDGINDAPALTAADVGFAVANGSDIAVDSADVVLMKNDLNDLSTAIRLGKKTVRNIKQNLFWAFFYNVLGIPIAAGALYATPLALKLNPMIAAAAMSVSSLFVVTNALRLNFFKPLKAAVEVRAPKSIEEKISSDNQDGITEPDVPDKEDKMKYKLHVEGMMCGHCVARVEKALKAVDGVKEVFVSLEEKCALVTTDGSVAEQALSQAVTAQDYSVTEVETL